MSVDISDILAFLPCETPQAWVDAALAHPEEMLIDHANCEKKAAGTALNLMFRYVDKPDLLSRMSKLAREELRHFEQVMAIMKKRGIEYRILSSARYANGLRGEARTSEPHKLIDILIIGALIEARSCERFARIAPLLDSELGAFYTSLLKSESRHFKDYLSLAERYANEDIAPRIELFKQKEQLLIETEDDVFRFHSGPLAA
ncbi:tRNA-(ms[2]io[6]A)-hydroxylase [Zhongshania arctica]|uniref:tRNA-(Ms[2]io[6]A)-hydroxylase n=1 Tax=Zhongshania arctica TaxID=3238302 RepID=A0ABV3TVV1_9GAMM|tara:strand:+ start:438 stop:1046 length:609 start_codon:yes stop_codon:yes gene_type:complete